MIDLYPGAIQMLVDQQRTFIGALAAAPSADLSIVIHKTACNAVCSAMSVANWFATNTTNGQPVGSNTHFVIDKDGTIVQCVRLSDGAAGNCCLETGHDTYWDGFMAKYGNLNLCTFSIEHCDYSLNNTDTPTSAQLAASFTLVTWLCNTFNIDPGRIKTHASLDPISKAMCPGNYPMGDLITFVKEHLVSTQFKTQQFNDVWSLGALPASGDHYNAALAAFMNNEMAACYPTGLVNSAAGPTIKTTVDWDGHPIEFLPLSNGYHTEKRLDTGTTLVFSPQGSYA